MRTKLQDFFQMITLFLNSILNTFLKCRIRPIFGKFEFHLATFECRPKKSIAYEKSVYLSIHANNTTGGYYTTLVEKGLRLVSLNTNYGHKENIWLAIKNEDPAGQLKWLVQVLLRAEKDGEKVHIIGHVPPGEKLHWYSIV